MGDLKSRGSVFCWNTLFLCLKIYKSVTTVWSSQNDWGNAPSVFVFEELLIEQVNAYMRTIVNNFPMFKDKLTNCNEEIFKTDLR